MDSRLELQEILEEILGTEYVYFQPPENVKINHPCIIYSRNSGDTIFAADKPYVCRIKYQVIAVSKDPDNLILTKILALPLCRFDRHYTASNLNHDVFNLYF